jgi:hypothetical protein
MRRTRVLWEAYVTRFEEALDRYKQGRLTAEEAGELLGLSGRHFRRQCARYEAEGVEGLRDKRLGRRSSRRAPASELARMRQLYREEYADFTVKHFHEEIRQRHGYHLGYMVTRLALQSAGLVKPAPRRGKHRKKRPRRPMPGMLLFQDGSQHRWIGALGHDLDLVVTLDDATGCIYSAILVQQDGTMSSFLGLHETIAALGCSVRSTPTAARTFPDAEGRWQGKQGASDPGGTGTGAIGYPSHPFLRTRGPRADGAGVRHLAAASAAGVAPRRCA